MANFVVTVTLHEFSIWQRLGTLRILAVRLIPVVCAEDEPEESPDLEGHLALRMPDYEEDFEIMHVIVALSSEPEALTITVGGSLAPRVLDLPIGSLCSIYAISERGRTVLRGKLGNAHDIKGVLCAQVTARRDEERERQQTQAGAEVLCDLLGTRSVPVDVAAEWLPRLMNGHRARGQGATAVKPELGFTANLMFYARRHPKIERTSDIGYFQDVVAICHDLFRDTRADSAAGDSGSGGDSQRAVRLVVEHLRATRERGARQFEALLRAHADDMEFLEAFIDGSAAAATVFLKLRDVLIVPSRASIEQAREFVSRLHDAEYAGAASLGVWLTGGYYGFSHFWEACQEWRRRERRMAVPSAALSTAHTAPGASKESPDAEISPQAGETAGKIKTTASSGVHVETETRPTTRPVVSADAPETQSGVPADTTLPSPTVTHVPHSVTPDAHNGREAVTPQVPGLETADTAPSVPPAVVVFVEPVDNVQPPAASEASAGAPSDGRVPQPESPAGQPEPRNDPAAGQPPRSAGKRRRKTRTESAGPPLLDRNGVSRTP